MSTETGRFPPGFVAGIGKVIAVESIGPHMRRIRIQAPELAALDCRNSPATAFRILIPPEGHPVVMPTPSLEKGLTYPEGTMPPAPRSVTVRSYDPTASTIDVDITTSHDGLLAGWATTVAAGAEVGFAGPRLFAPLPDGPLVLLGDETAIPAIASIIENSAKAPIFVGIEVESGDDQVVLGAHVSWLHRKGRTGGVALLDSLTEMRLPEGAVVWVAGESGMALAVRKLMRSASPKPAHVRACGYWKAGTSTQELDEVTLELTQELVAAGESMEILDEFALAFEEACQTDSQTRSANPGPTSRDPEQAIVQLTCP